MLYVVVFLASGTLVVLAGTFLARWADAIAAETGLGRLWIGSVVLAAGTSLPELVTDIAAVRLDAANLAAGDLFGSSMANMLILALIDLLPPRRRVLQKAALDHALAACLAIVLNAMAGMLVLLRPERKILGVDVGALLLLAVFLGGARVVYRYALRQVSTGSRRKGHGLRGALIGFSVAAMAVLVTAPVFAWSARGIADLTGLGTTFVGTWLVGLSTSLPELVTSLAAVRMGAFDLAVGNLFGSNAFNMAIFFFLDVAQPGGGIFADLDAGHALSAFLAAVLTGLGLAAIVYGAEQRYAMIEPDSVLMVVTYALGIWLLYVFTVGGSLP